MKPRHPILHLQLLGGFRIEYGDAPLTGINAARLQSLVASLVLRAGIPQTRQQLSYQQWPDAAESQARNNLRQFLYQLRQALPDAHRFLTADAATVCWNSDAGQQIDVLTFVRAVEEARGAERRGDAPALRQALERAVAVYQGDLLPGCYDDWIAPEREQLRQQFAAACWKLVQVMESASEFAAAIEVAQRLQRLDPLDESAYVALVRLHGSSGDRSGARRVYRTALETLDRELGVEPGEALQIAYQRSQRSLPAAAPNDDGPSIAGYRLAGREAEWLRLYSIWETAAAGKAQLCLITGEAGIGKSRLAEELFGRCGRQGFTTASTRCYGVEGALSLAPVSEWLRSKALSPHLRTLEPVWLTEVSRLVPDLLSKRPDLARPDPVTDYRRRRIFFEALARGILAAPHPILLWIDDLHWCDQETLEWLHFFLRFDVRAPVLIMSTARSEDLPPEHPLSSLVRQLRADARVSVIDLSALDAAETARLAAEVEGRPLDDAEIVGLYRQTGGNPLFIVETLRAGLPADGSSLSAAQGVSSPVESAPLPPRVQAVIASRLVELSPVARSIAAIGAAVGRAFSLDLLALAGGESEERVVEALKELWQRRIVREVRANLFDFTHDRLRDVTYAETAPPERRLLHRRIARALETQYAEELDPICGPIAAQYEQAGLFDPAIRYYRRAASVAAGVYANEDAMRLLTHALALLSQLPATAKRDSQELALQLSLSTLYRVSKGWASPEEERVMQRVMELSDKVGDVGQRLGSLFAVQALYLVQARYDQVERMCVRAEELFAQGGIDPPPSAALYQAGARFFTGRVSEARELFAQVIAGRDDGHLRELLESHGINYVVHALAWDSHATWCLGYPERALDGALAAVDFARECKEPFNRALAITYLAMLQMWCADAYTCLACAEEARTFAAEYQAPYYYAYADIVRCYAQAVISPGVDHVSGLRDAIHRFTDSGARTRLPVYYSLLADACVRAGQLDEGLGAVDLAFEQARRSNERWWDAEIHRLRGELLWARGAQERDVDGAFQCAREIAQMQQARSLELRAATSLARFRQERARAPDARRCLSEVFDGFAEGFDTPDLQAARALLAGI